MYSYVGDYQIRKKHLNLGLCSLLSVVRRDSGYKTDARLLAGQPLKSGG